MSKTVRPPVAVIGMACWYPGASNPRLLWENILSRRRQFRRIPERRLPMSDYFGTDPDETDKTYARRAAVIDGFEFDWAGKRIPFSTFQATDIAHWLAFEVALAALADAGYTRESIPGKGTGVIVGNSLTGEQSRTNAMRLRWPFVRRALRGAAQSRGMTMARLAYLETAFEQFYKSVFPPVNEDSLAGGLSNTIAGRICNFLDIHGGGYTVDGACSSSLLAVATGAGGLVSGDLDLAIVGGVDISLDTFELIGFARTGALTPTDMRVYDRRGDGFIPGEGCGFVVLKRLEDARKDRDYVYAVLQGWGISSDGKSTGITAPSAGGQAEALMRTYRKAPYGMDALHFVEGHGTGTTIGDKVELEAISMAMNRSGKFSDTDIRPCGITSMKSIIGHTKAASGVAGFIKAVIAVNRRVLPPTANCGEPHPAFDRTAHRLFPVTLGEVLPPQTLMRAGISAMGFGGINCHATVESADPPSIKLEPVLEESVLTASNQETELLVLTSESTADLLKHIDQLTGFISRISHAELADLAFALAQKSDPRAAFKVAVVTDGPENAESRLTSLREMIKRNLLKSGEILWDPARNLWYSNLPNRKRIAALFPGQGSQKLNMGRMPAIRFDWGKDLIRTGDKWLLEGGCEPVADRMFKPVDRASTPEVTEDWFKTLSLTKFAQPGICLTSLIWYQFLRRMGVDFAAAGGHSLGELTAFYAAGVFDERQLVEFAGFRGKAMSEGGEGAMVSLFCSRDAAERLLKKINGYLVVANINGPNQMVLSGQSEAVDCAIKIAAREGIQSRRLAVSRAFHSDLAADAAREIQNFKMLDRILESVSCRLFSSVTGKETAPGIFLNRHFSNQLLSMVQFESMIKSMASCCDLFLEVGPGRVLTGLVNDILGPEGPICLPVESSPSHDTDLSRLAAAIFVCGQQIRWNEFYAGRLIRPFTLPDDKRFIENPCEGSFNVSHLPEVPIVTEALEGRLAEMVNIDPQTLSEYLNSRGGFLSKVIQADLESFAPDTLQPAESAAPETPAMGMIRSAERPREPSGVLQPAIGGPPEEKREDLETVILSTVEKMTGFARETLSMEMRLLDDLNLDSIKAGDFIAKVRKTAGLEKHIEPLEFANARLSDIAEALKSLQETGKPEVLPASTGDALRILVKETSRVSGYPEETLDPDALVETDLHLTMEMLKTILKVFAEHLGIDTQVDLEPLRHRSLRQISDIFARISRTELEKFRKPQALSTAYAAVAGGTTWVREFKMELVEKPVSPMPEWGGKRQEDNWENQTALVVAASEQSELGESIRDALLRNGAKAAVVSSERCIRENLIHDPSYSVLISLLPMETGSSAASLEEFRHLIERLAIIPQVPAAARAPRRRTTVAYVQFGGGFFGFHRRFASVNRCSATGLAKSLHLERADLRVRVVDFSPGVEAGIIAEKLLIELHTPQAFCAAGYDHDLTRREAIFQLLLPSEYRRRNIQWSEEDVVAVTGGAGGITAACAFSLAKKTGCRMALIGRSPHPDHAPEPDSGKFIAKWLTKYRELGLEARYYCCDVTDKNAVVEIMKKIRTEMGPVTGIIHGAGINHPRLLNRVSPEEAREETAPKVMGALNLLESVGESPPKLIVGMSSIIGMTGMPGNGWYGFSNEAMDLILKRFETDHPETQTLSIAFSVWDELGMGARMGSVEKLKAMGIEPIPVKEGVERFLRQVLSDAGVGRVLVTARLGGLDTWSTTGPPAPGKARYLETLLSATPFVESIFSCRLNLQHDPYLKDHVFNGSYLFPTVFGLEAMAQVAAHVSGQHGFRPVRFQDIRLDRPITVDPQTGAEILLWARMDDSLGQNGTHVIRAGIVKPDDHAERSCFSAMIVLNIQEHPESEIIETPGSPLRIAPSQDLYRPNLLFQGPMFQRLKTVWTLDNARENAETAVFDAAISDASAAAQIAFSNADHQHLYLGDPFFRDTLLQSAQMVVPRQTCLPVRIQNLEIFPKTTPNETALRCRIRVISIDDRQIDTDVVAVDDSGNVLERLSGYRLHILNHQPGNPEARDLVDPQDRDNRRMDELLDQYCNAFGFVKPAFSLGLLENIHWKPVGLRHQLELPIIERAIEAASDMFDIPEHSLNVTWNSENKPEITGQMPEKYGISLSHDSMYCGCVIGPEAQGVDIVEAQHRTRGQWVELLGGSFTELLDKLLDDSDTLDMAGARIWSAKEAVKKAFGNVPGSLNIHRISGEVVVFYAGPAGSVMTFPELLTRGPNRMFAFVVHPQREMSPVILEHTGYVGYDELFDTQHFATIPGGPQGQGMFVHRIPVTFLPNKQLSRTVSFSNYLFWLGDIREASLWPVLETVGKQFASGNYGLVTNRADLHILGEATAKDRVEIRMWVSGNSGSADSTMDLNFDFRKILPGGSHERLAWCEQAVTWVRILEHGIVKPEPYPEYYWNSMKDILPKHDSPNVREPLPEPLKRLRDAETDPNLYLAPSGPVVKPVLRRETFDTSLEHSNLVGNVYFANYYTWQGQTRDRYFFSVIPEHFRGTGESGEMLCLRTWIQHLREAMPFDRIEVTMALKQLKPAMAVLYFEYFRVAPDGVRQKLAYGEHQAHWVTRDKNGHPSPAGFPQKVHRAFADAISEK